MMLLSFERGPDSGDRNQVLTMLKKRNIEWTVLRYHKQPPVLSTAFDAVRGLAAALGHRGLDLIHARSHVPAMIGHIVRGLRGIPFLFDHRGLMGDEYAAAGVWKKGGVLQRITEAFEGRFLRAAQGVVVLTDRYRRELRDSERVAVIPCAVDLAQFHPPLPNEPRPFDLVYAGASTGLYLLREALLFFEAYRDLQPQARLLILTADRSYVGELPRGAEARQAAPDEVPGFLRQARAGLSFRKSGRAQIAASPVKVSEYLASGLAVVSTAGVGDLDELLPAEHVGVIVPDTSRTALCEAARRLRHILEQAGPVAARCRRVAERRYDLAGAVAAYDELYRAILARGRAA